MICRKRAPENRCTILRRPSYWVQYNIKSVQNHYKKQINFNFFKKYFFENRGAAKKSNDFVRFLCYNRRNLIWRSLRGLPPDFLYFAQEVQAMLNITQKTENKAVVFSLEGRLDTVTAEQLEAAVSQALPEAEELTLDFEKLDYISSAGLRVLLSTQKQMLAKAGSMRVCHVNETILEIFEVTGFSDILTIEA